MGTTVALARRWSWLAQFWLVQAAVLYAGWVTIAWGNRVPDAWFERALDHEVVVWGWGTILSITALQAAFLSPIPKPAMGRGPGVGMGVRLLGVGVVIAILAGAAAAIAVDLAHLARDDFGEEGKWGGVCVLFALVGSWLIATPLLIAFARRAAPADFLSRLAPRLFLGTMIEFGAALPVAILVSRRSRCYCAEASIWAVVFLGALGFLVMGPAVLVPVLGKRRRRS